VMLTTAAFLQVILPCAPRLRHLRTIVLLDDAVYEGSVPATLRVVRCADLRAAPIHDTLAHHAAPSDIASIIYTSGTSGPAK
ncbi:ATP-dependent acyl-CoA ligase, partial [Bordetella holmesii]|nr:ATP-dependent acyl-CoA ligase [Bordetella holmesii]